MRALKVLVVDDDPDFAEGVALTLELAGHDVSFAYSGEEAVKKSGEQAFDLTLMDVRMPGMTGVESFLELRKLKPDAKVMMMTAYSVEDLLRRALDQGAVGVLHKPISEQTLLAALREAKPRGLILLADDDPEYVEGMQLALSGAGHTVTVARTGKEAVEMALGYRLDVLLLDMRLPILNGLDVYLELKKHGRILPTIIVTGYALEEADAIAALREMSVKHLLVKPVAPADLLQGIDDVMQEAP